MVVVRSTIAVATRRSARCFRGDRSPFLVGSNVQSRNLICSSSILPDFSTRPTASSATGIRSEPSISFTQHSTGRFLSSTPGVAGRSRKRPRNRQRSASLPSIGGGENGDGSRSGAAKATKSPALTKTATQKSSHDDENDSSSQQYPEGKPWRVLWPRPHGAPESSEDLSLWDIRKKIPTTEQLKKAWSLYKETWEDGITGIPTRPTERANTTSGESVDDGGSSTSSSAAAGSPTLVTQQQLQEIGDNAANNLNIVRKDAQDLLERTKETTGIRTQDDLKALASEAMIIATECIREFMGGYRKGRDTEIDKVLHEYFQDEEEDEEETRNGPNALVRENSKGKPEIDTKNTLSATPTEPTGRKKKRKPKRGIPRR